MHCSKLLSFPELATFAVQILPHFATLLSFGQGASEGACSNAGSSFATSLKFVVFAFARRK